MKTTMSLFGILTIAAALAVQVHAQDGFTNGLVAYYPFSGNANDPVGANNGTVHEAALTKDRFGNPDSAYSFNGTSAYIETTRPLPDMQSASASCWISVPGFPPLGYGRYVFMDGDATGGRDFIVAAGGGTNIWLVTKDNTEFPGSVPLLTNKWLHVVAVADNNNNVLKIWLNGQLVDTSPSLGNANVGYHSRLCIGCRAVYYDCLFDGAIDDLRLYNRALSDSEVQELYLYESTTCPGPFINSQPRNQVGYWGKSVTFTVGAAGVSPLSYQWQKDTAPIAGATESSLVLTNLQMADAGNYSVVVVDGCGSTTSRNACLTMNPAGVSLALYSGITIDGIVGLTYGIQYSADLSNTNGWQGLANVTLGAPTELWFDVQPANQPRRYYRVIPGPIPIP